MDLAIIYVDQERAIHQQTLQEPAHDFFIDVFGDRTRLYAQFEIRWNKNPRPNTSPLLSSPLLFNRRRTKKKSVEIAFRVNAFFETLVMPYAKGANEHTLTWLPKSSLLALRALAPDPASVFSFPPLSLCGPGCCAVWLVRCDGAGDVGCEGVESVKGWSVGWLEGCQVLEDVDGRADCEGVG